MRRVATFDLTTRAGRDGYEELVARNDVRVIEYNDYFAVLGGGGGENGSPPEPCLYRLVEYHEVEPDTLGYTAPIA